MNGLMLHCGAKEVGVPMLRAIPTPEGTSTHIPIPHYDFQNLVKGNLYEGGFEVVEETHAVMTDNNKYFGLMRLKSSFDDFATVIGLRNSHDKTLKSGVTIGDTVFVCDNLCFDGEDIVLRKHTVHILRDLPILIEELFEKVTPSIEAHQERIAAYKDMPLPIRSGNDVLAQMHLEGSLGSTKLSKAIKEYNKPSHNEFKDRNVWRLRNAVTDVFKGNVFQLPKISKKLTEKCDKLADFDVKKALAA